MEVESFLISADDALLVIVDIQENLVKAMKDSVAEAVIQNVKKLIELAKIMSIPLVVTEQYPKGLGKTLSQISELTGVDVVEKVCFSCVGEEKFIEKLIEIRRKKVILTGMETHVCILQTCIDLIMRDYKVFVPSDAVCSRRKEDWKAGLELMREAGAVLTTTETLIFQILKRAGTKEFKRMLEFVK